MFICSLSEVDLLVNCCCGLQNIPDISTSITPIPVPEQPQVGLVNLVGQAVPPPPPITGNVDPTKIEEIRRTIYVGNLNTNVSLILYI